MKMRLKKRLAIILACVCAVYTLCQVSVSRADELEDAQGQSSDLKNELDSINQELLEISNKIAENESKMESMEGDIIKTQEQLSIAKKNEEAQYEDMKVRIQYIYENDSATMLSMIFSADNLTDFVNKIDFVQTVSDYDRDMLTELVTLREAIEEEETHLKEQKESYKETEEQLSQQKESLKVKAAATSTDLSELQTKIQELKAAEEKKKEEAAKAEKAPSSDSSGQSGNSGTGNNSNNSSSSGGSSSNKKYNYPSGPGQLNPWVGVVYFNGHRETYYSQRVLPGYGLKIPGRHVASDGTIRDSSNYICVAAHLDEYSRGQVVQTSLGPGKVYDTGCAKGTIDLYTDW